MRKIKGKIVFGEWKDDIRLQHPELPVDTCVCSACGQARPFPTTEGKWEYRELGCDWFPCIIKISNGKEHHEAEEGSPLFYMIFDEEPDKDDISHDETVEKTEDGYVVGPRWWPDNSRTMWRKIS